LPVVLLLAEAKVDAGLASRGSGGSVNTFSRAMALRRLHWKNSLLGELLYLVNVSKVGVQTCNSRWCRYLCRVLGRRE